MKATRENVKGWPKIGSKVKTKVDMEPYYSNYGGNPKMMIPAGTEGTVGSVDIPNVRTPGSFMAVDFDIDGKTWRAAYKKDEVTSSTGVKAAKEISVPMRMTIDTNEGVYELNVSSYEDASKKYEKLRDKFAEETGLGASGFGFGTLEKNGVQFAYVSYNGKVFDGSPQNWKPGRDPIYVPQGMSKHFKEGPQIIDATKVRADYPEQSLNEIAFDQGKIERHRKHRDDPSQPAYKDARSAYDAIYPNSMLGTEHLKSFTKGFDSGEKYAMKTGMKFKADFDLVPTNSRDLPEGYLQLQGVEDPGSSAPGGMNVQDWVIYRANWLAAIELLPEGGVEGEAAFIKEHPGEEYPGDVVHDDFINVYKGAATRVNEANELVKNLQNYLVIDEGKQSELENEALEEELDSWALDDAKDQFGYDKYWADELTDEEAAWMAQQSASNQAHAELEKALDAIFEPTGDDEQMLRRAVRDGLTYGDWTVVHLEPMIDALKQEGAGHLADPVATMHQFIKQEMQNAAPGSAADMKKKEEQGQQRLFESLRGARQTVIGRAEIKDLLASDKTVRASLDAAAPIAKLVGGHQPAEAYGSAFFTYSVKGQLVAASITAFPDQTFGAAWTRLSFFKGAEQAASRLAGTSMLSFEAGTKAELVAQIMATVDPVQDYQGHMGTNVLCAASRVRLQMWAKTPKGFEPVVKELKKSKDVDNPWAVAWSMKNKGIRPKASANPVPAIESILANDEASTDEELVQHFMSEMKLPEAEARSWVARRNDYLKGVVGYYIGGHFIEARGRSRVKGAIKAIGNEDIPGYEPKEDEPEGKFSIEDVDDAESPGDFTDEDGEHDVAEVAGWWHGGQFTELYKLSSSGTFDSIDGLVAEIKSNVKEGDDSEGNGLNFLLDWAEAIRKASGEKS